MSQDNINMDAQPAEPPVKKAKVAAVKRHTWTHTEMDSILNVMMQISTRDARMGNLGEAIHEYVTKIDHSVGLNGEEIYELGGPLLPHLTSEARRKKLENKISDMKSTYKNLVSAETKMKSRQPKAPASGASVEAKEEYDERMRIWSDEYVELPDKILKSLVSHHAKLMQCWGERFGPITQSDEEGKAKKSNERKDAPKNRTSTMTQELMKRFDAAQEQWKASNDRIEGAITQSITGNRRNQNEFIMIVKKYRVDLGVPDFVKVCKLDTNARNDLVDLLTDMEADDDCTNDDVVEFLRAWI